MKQNLPLWRWSTNLFTNSANPTFWGCKVFAQFPNTSPSGKRVDSDDLIPRKLSYSGRKCHPQNVEVDTCPPKNSQRSYRGSFLKLPPTPKNRELVPLNFFTVSSLSSESFQVLFTEKLFVTRSLRFRDFLSFQRYCFLCFSIMFFRFWTSDFISSVSHELPYDLHLNYS
jgi:hypothetical protein